MPSAELIAIGTELLLGEIQDTNSRFLARQLRDLGVDLFRTTTIGDNSCRIAASVNESLSRVDIVITTGGLGPTIDDPTRDAIALAFTTTTEFHPEIWKVIEKRFLRRGVTPTENNKRQAYLPVGAKMIPNPVGTAPAFSIQRGAKTVFCLPGVPKEMEHIYIESILPQIKEQYQLHSLIKVKVIHLAGIGESVVDQPIAELEVMSNPTVGLVAYPGLVDIRITAKAIDDHSASEMIEKIQKQVIALFPDDFYGFDDQSLAAVLATSSEANNISITILENGLDGKWPFELKNSTRISLAPSDTKIDLHCIKNELSDISNLCFYCNYSEQAGESCLEYVIQFGSAQHRESLIYNGPQAQASVWATNRAMDIIRRMINKHLK